MNKFPLHSRSNAFLSLPNGEKNDLEQITFFSLSFSRDSSSSETMKKATSEQKFPHPFKFVFTRRRGKTILNKFLFDLFSSNLSSYSREGSFSFQIRRFLYDVRVTLALFKLCLSISLSVCSPFVQTGEHRFSPDFPLCKPRGYTVIRVFN